MINIYRLLAQLTSEEVESLYFFLEDLKLSGKAADERDSVLKEINEEFPA